MKKCKNCGTEFEGNCCPNCGTWASDEKTCPNCGAKLPSDAKFCNACGFSFGNKASQKSGGSNGKLASVGKWIKSHLKIVISVTVAVLLIIILSCTIPAVVKAKDNGTYYSLTSSGEIETSSYYVIKSGKWNDQDGIGGTYSKKGEKVTFYMTLFGEKMEFGSGTVKDGVLTLEGDVYVSNKHKHKYSNWEITREATCTADGLETRSCSCGFKQTNTIEKAGHQGEWNIEKEATCVEKGLKTVLCTVCNQKISEEIDYAEHITIWLFDADSHYKICKVCREEVETGKHTGSKVCTKCECPIADTAGLSFTLNSDNKGYTVNSIGTATDSIIRIPAVYNNLPVTSIGASAFSDCSSLTGVIIPDSVISIDFDAFGGCVNLLSIILPNSVTSIGRSAFEWCSSLTGIIIPDSVTSIGDGAFYGCSSLTSIVIPDSVTSIGSYAFSHCSSLTIYCKAESKPSGWNGNWNPSNCPVVWGYKGD